jgi:hypothetical protein
MTTWLTKVASLLDAWIRQEFTGPHSRQVEGLRRHNADLRAALEELLAAREEQHRVGLWPERFPHIGRSPTKPKGAARNRFEIWYTRATVRVIKAEEQAHAALAAAGGEEAK